MANPTDSASAPSLKRVFPQTPPQEKRRSKRRRVTQMKVKAAVEKVMEIRNTLSSDLSKGNVVAISEKNFKQFFPENIVSAKHLYIGDYLYQVVTSTSAQEEHVQVNSGQFEDLNQINYLNYVNHTVSSLNDTGKYPELSHAVFTLSVWSTMEFEGERKNLTQIDVDTLSEIMIKTFQGQYFRKDQGLLIDHPEVGMLMARLTKRTYAHRNTEDSTHKNEVPRFGYIGPNTVIDFINGSYAFELTMKKKNTSLDKVYAKITSVEEVTPNVITAYRKQKQEAWKRGAHPLPVIVEAKKLTDVVRTLLQEDSVFVRFKGNVDYHENWKLNFQITQLDLKNNKDIMDQESTSTIHNLRKKYIDDYKVKLDIGDTPIHLDKSKGVIFTRSLEEARVAKRATFILVNKDLEFDLAQNDTLRVYVEELKGYLRDKVKHVTEGQYIMVPIEKGKLLMMVDAAFNDDEKDKRPLDTFQDIWEIGEETDLRFRADDVTNITLVDEQQPIILNSVKVKVDLEPPKKNLLMMLFGGKGKEQEKKIIKEEELRELFLDICPATVGRKQVITGTTRKGDCVQFTIDEVDISRKRKRDYPYGDAYKIGPDTQLEITTKKESHVIIGTKAMDVEITNLRERLMDLNVGGLPDECLSLLNDLILSRRKYKTHYRDNDVMPERGAIFHGPPGTGKSELARNLGKLLGAKGSCFQLASADSFLDMWVGNTEKNIRKWFEPARKAQELAEETGEESPLFVYALDEADILLRNRKLALQGHEVSRVNAMITQLDGIAGKEGKSLDNIFFIALTNHIEKIDDAVKRPGRLGTHIKIGIPNTEGRRDIFKIHTKTLKEEGRFGEDYDDIINWLVNATVGKTGAFIKGLVTKAFAHNVRRIDQLNLTDEEIKNDRRAKLTPEDFENAYMDMLICSSDGKDAPKNDLKLKGNATIEYSGIREELRRHQLGGVPNDVVNVLKDIMVTRFLYRESLEKLSYNFPRGILLAGQSGTGKSSLVKALPDLFGLNHDTYRCYSASDLWQKYTGNLKEEIKEIFRPAHDAADHLGDESPLYVVVIEDIDRLYKATRRDDRVRNTTYMNDFLSELDNVLEEESKKRKKQGEKKNVNNLLVIATMTSNEEFHPDMTKYGQFGVHVKMDVPDAKGRKEIFEIYLKDWIREGLLDQDVDLDRLANLTADRKRTGDYIKGLVTKAITYPLHRAEAARSNNNQRNNEARFKLKMKDFEKAIQEMETNHMAESLQRMML